jgi:methylamine dehydrogenase accessory protein MauD
MAEALFISNLLLWGVVIVMAIIIVALARQVGVLYERVAPAGALMVNSRLKPGEPGPEMDVVDLDGRTLHVGGAAADGKGLMLFFTSPTCPVCRSLLPALVSAARSEKSWLRVMLVSDGEEAEHRAYIAAHGLEDFPYVSSALLGARYGVSKLPYAVLLDENGGIVSMGIVNSREHLESLFESRERGVASIQDHLRG